MCYSPFLLSDEQTIWCPWAQLLGLKAWLDPLPWDHHPPASDVTLDKGLSWASRQPSSGTCSLSVCLWKTWQVRPWRKLPTGQGAGPERLHCPYLELPPLGLALLLQNMFILVSSPSWLPDRHKTSVQQLELRPGPGRARLARRTQGQECHHCCCKL